MATVAYFYQYESYQADLHAHGEEFHDREGARVKHDFKHRHGDGRQHAHRRGSPSLTA